LDCSGTSCRTQTRLASRSAGNSTTSSMPRPITHTQDLSQPLLSPPSLTPLPPRVPSSIPSSHPSHTSTSASPPPPCCHCHSRYATSHQKDYLSCLDINRGRPLDECECKGDCPPGCCALQQCVRSHKAGERRRDEDQHQHEPARRSTRKRPHSPHSITDSPPHKRITSQHPSHDVTTVYRSSDGTNGSGEIIRQDETGDHVATSDSAESDGPTDSQLEQKYNDCKEHVAVNPASPNPSSYLPGPSVQPQTATSTTVISSPALQAQTYTQYGRTRRAVAHATTSTQANSLTLSALQEDEAATRQLNREKRQLHQPRPNVTHGSAQPHAAPPHSSHSDPTCAPLTFHVKSVQTVISAY